MNFCSRHQCREQTKNQISMSKIYVVTKKEYGEYNEDGVWYSILAAFDTRNKAKEYLKEYEKTAPKEAFYTSYSIESIPMFISPRKVKMGDKPKQSTYPIGDIMKLEISSKNNSKSE